MLKISNNMNIQETRNSLMAEKLIKNLQKRHYDAYYCPKCNDIRDKVKELLTEGNYHVFDRDDVTTSEDKLRIYRKAFECDYYLASVNAMSEDGVIVNIDGNGNRVAAITWGPEHVILIVSLNKVCQDVDAAIKRARSTAAPINMARFDLPKTPCKVDGLCHDCLSADSICNYVSIQRMSHPAHRHIVLLTNEILGY